jgi:hypothetical protein
MPVIGKNIISWFYAYIEDIEIKTKTINIIHFPYLDLSQNVKIRDVSYSFIQCIVTGFNLEQMFMTPVLVTAVT